MAEPYAPLFLSRPAQGCLTNLCAVSPESAPSHMTITCDISTLRFMAPRNLHTKVCPAVPKREGRSQMQKFSHMSKQAAFSSSSFSSPTTTP